jgi:translation initiation factor 2B subunit (eIF-2B alpha/beta/delta family)
MVDFVEAVEAYSPDDYPEAVRQIADLLLDAQPAIAPLVGLVNTVYLGLGGAPDALAAELRAVETRLAASVATLSRVGAALVEEGAIVLTHGGSGSVQAMLVEAAEERRFAVTCVATMPFGEGVEMAADLAAAGLSVEVLPDDAVAEAMPGVDLVVVGANAFGSRHLMNTVGTARVAAEARNEGVPLYVLASADKALPAPLFERAVKAGVAAGRFEPVALERATGIVTESGVLDPEAAGDLAADRRVSPALLAKM